MNNSNELEEVITSRASDDNSRGTATDKEKTSALARKTACSSSTIPTGHTSNTSSSIVQGVGGFINDFRALTLEIQRLRNSEKTFKKVLQLKQLELNKASEEWCTALAEQAKNEMLIESQNVQINSLKRQKESMEMQNNFWDSKLNQAGTGLAAIFQRATKLAKEDGNEVGSEIRASTSSSGNLNLELQMQPFLNNPPSSKPFMGGPTTRNLKVSYRNGVNQNTNYLVPSFQWKSGSLQQKMSAANNAKVKSLRERLSKRMAEKKKSNQGIKNELARKNKLLQNLAQLLNRNRLRQTMNLNRVAPVKVDIGVSSSRQTRNMGLQRALVSDKPKKTASSSPAVAPTATSGSGNHARDPSLAVHKGYGCICGERYKYISTLHRHLGKGEGENSKKFSCDDCNATYLFFSEMNRHLRERHKRFLPSKMHGCRWCGAMFPSKTELMKGWKHRNGKCMKKKKKNKTPTLN